MLFKRKPLVVSKPPTIIECLRHVSYDDEGNEVISYVQPDLADYGDVDDYSLSSMRSAGIDPASIHISTSAQARIETMNDFDKFASAAENLVKELSNPDVTS